MTNGLLIDTRCARCDKHFWSYVKGYWDYETNIEPKFITKEYGHITIDTIVKGDKLCHRCRKGKDLSQFGFTYIAISNQGAFY